MTWLVFNKLYPSLLRQSSPPYYSELQANGPQDSTIRWRIFWNEQPIGSSTSRVNRKQDGAATIESQLLLRNLSVEQMAREFIGPVASWFPVVHGDRNVSPVDLELNTSMAFSTGTQFESLQSEIVLLGSGTVASLEAARVEDRLQIQVFGPPATSKGERAEVFQQQFALRADERLVDTLSPQSRLANLVPGQTWTVRAYRFFPPSDPVRMIQASVEETELLLWHGNLVATHLVVYRDDEGQTPTVSREPLGRMWVASDGTVLQQEADFGNVTLRFVREERGAPEGP